MEELLTFKDVAVATSNPHLLLGNGFSIAYDPMRFSFTTLLESAVVQGIIAEDSYVYRVFQRLETADFESVMKILEESEKVVEVYEGDEDLRNLILGDIDSLKDYLVRIITNNHPEKSTDITELEKRSCIEFLSKFKNIYTLNYDLLLYWSTVIDESLGFTDGFGDNEESLSEGYVVYKNMGSFRVHYLHGGLHIFDAGSDIIKKTYSNTGINLVVQIRENLDRKIYPIFISEGSSAQKKTKIMHNSYLNHCFKSLRSISGDLVVLGTLLKKNDEHILHAIIESKVKNIYLGVSDATKDSVDVRNVIAKIEEFNVGKTEPKKKHLFLYDYKTVNVWGR